MFDETKFNEKCALVTYDPTKNVHLTIDRVVALYLFGTATSIGLMRWIESTVADEQDDFAQFLYSLKEQGITCSEDLLDASTDEGN